MTSKHEGFAIYHDFLIDTSPTAVFEAVSNATHLINWWPLKCTGEPKVGGIYNFYFTPEYDWYGQVTEYSPGQAFYIKMTKSDEDWGPTSFGFDFLEVDGKVQVKFWHIGWPACNAHFRRSSFCWAILLNGLKNYLEKGLIVPFDERE